MMSQHQIKHIDDQDVQDIAGEAASAAAGVLDAMFPGWDAGGISSNFVGYLKETILNALAGRDRIHGRTTQTELEQLILTDNDFGAPLTRAEMFVVTRTNGDDWSAVADGSLGVRAVPRVEVLNASGTGFCKPAETDKIDPCTSYEAAVQVALAWLRREGVSQDNAMLSIAPVALHDDRYIINPDRNRRTDLVPG